MSSIIERQTITIHKSTNGIQGWYEDLGLNFKPDTVVIRQVTCTSSNSVATMAVTVPWIDSRDNILITWVSDLDVPSVSNPMVHYRLKDSGNLMNGQTHFGLNVVTNTLDENNVICQLSITLEFQMHEKQRNIDDVIISSTNAMVKTMIAKGCIYPFCLPVTQPLSHCGSGAEGQFDVNANVEAIPDVHRNPVDDEVQPVLPTVAPVVTPVVDPVAK